MSIPIALQLYSVRKDCTEDLFGVLREVARMGYAGVEFAGYYGHGAAEIKRVLDDLGLVAEGTHTGMDALSENNFNATVDLHKTLDCRYVIIPWIPEDMRNTSAACRSTAEKLSELTQRLAKVGLRCGFHAHEGDMRPLDNGRCAWDMLAEGTPKEFILQYDTANGMSGGADPVQPILDWPGRAESVHLKGWSGQHGAIIGEDDIPWQKVFDACESTGGTKWYVVEHEDEKHPPLQAVEQCLKNLHAMGK